MTSQRERLREGRGREREIEKESDIREMENGFLMTKVKNMKWKEKDDKNKKSR